MISEILEFKWVLDREFADILKKEVRIESEQIYPTLENGRKMRSYLFYSALTNAAPRWPIDRVWSIDFMMAVEMMHLASCMVDDIIDGDGIRHGRPSSHQRIWDTGAILDSHLLVSWALQRMNKASKETWVWELLDRFQATYHNLCIGENNDVFRYWLPKLGYTQDVSQKTSAMFRFVMEWAALMRGDENKVELFGEVGEAIWILYQVSNDFWDTQIRNQKLRNKGNRFQVTCSMPLAEHLAEHGTERLWKYIRQGSVDREIFYTFLRKMWTPATRLRAQVYFDQTIQNAHKSSKKLPKWYLKNLIQAIITTVVEEKYWYHPL